MDCQIAQTVLLDPQDPSVDRVTLLDAVAHALACESCRTFAQDMRRIESVLRVSDDERIETPRGGYAVLAVRLAPAGNYRRGPMRWVAGAAAVAALVVAAYLLGSRDVTQPPVQLAVASNSADQFAFTPEQVTQSSKAFAQVTQAFDRRADWVWNGDRAADVGVGQMPADSTQPVLLLKLVLRSRERVLSSGDLAIVSGREARLSLPLENGKQVRYIISTRADQPDRIGITVELLEGNGSAKPLAALSTRLQAVVGQPLRAGEMVTTSGEYEVITSFARAEAKGGI